MAIAWIVIQLATSVILDRFWSKIIALACWLLAALNIIGLLDRTVSLLESIGFTVGEVKIEPSYHHQGRGGAHHSASRRPMGQRETGKKALIRLRTDAVHPTDADQECQHRHDRRGHPGGS